MCVLCACLSCVYLVHALCAYVWCIYSYAYVVFHECLTYVLCVCLNCVHMLSVYLLHVSVWTGPDRQTLGLEGRMAHLGAFGW